MATPEELAQLVQQEHTDEISALEEGAIAVLLAGTGVQFERLIRRTLTAWTVAFGSPDALAASGATLNRLMASVRSAVRRIVGDLGKRAVTALTEVLPSIAQSAARQGTQFVVAASGRPFRQPPTRVAASVSAGAAVMADAVDEQVSRSLAALKTRAVRRWSDVLTGIGIARSATSTVERHVATAVTEVVNDTLQMTVRTVGGMRLWIAEADACVTCSAYSGLLADAGASFPGGLSWDPSRRTDGADRIDLPPLHPRCRCRVLPWLPRWSAGEVPLPLHLQRQARSNIAHGHARPSESRAARVRAAAELLRSGVDLPPDVRAAAQRAVRDRRFAAA